MITKNQSGPKMTRGLSNHMEPISLRAGAMFQSWTLVRAGLNSQREPPENRGGVTHLFRIRTVGRWTVQRLALSESRFLVVIAVFGDFRCPACFPRDDSGIALLLPRADHSLAKRIVALKSSCSISCAHKPRSASIAPFIETIPKRRVYNMLWPACP